MSAAGRGRARNPRDFYKTPPHAYENLKPILQETLRPSDLVWEPAAGDFRIVNWLKDQLGIPSIGTDIAKGCDFLDPDFRVPYAEMHKPSWIITNPPYSLALEFCQAALEDTPHVRHVLLLLRLNFLGSIGRYEFFKKHPVKALLHLAKRPAFVRGGTDMCEYGWFYWGPQYRGICVLP